MTCKSCIHFDACLTKGKTQYYGKILAYDDVEERCKFFKNKADVVEVVRCAECRHYSPGGCANGFGWCEFYNTGAMNNHYCSHGERKEVANSG